MSKETFTIAYDGPALHGGAMDVRDLAPALLALGQLLDAANTTLNGDAATIKLQVKAAETGSFEISFELTQHWSYVLAFFESSQVSGATNLLSWVLGIPAVSIGGTKSLIWLTKKLRGKTPEKVEKLSDNMVRLIFDGETFDVPIELLRLYQDVAVRVAAQKLVEEPLKTVGIDTFRVKKGATIAEEVTKIESISFSKPILPDEILVDEIRRSAFSIVSLAFKEDNKWRLYDGNTQISATIEDLNFLTKVNQSQIAFSKGDILICDVRVLQKRAADGLRTDYIVVQVLEHRPAARQLPLPL